MGFRNDNEKKDDRRDGPDNSGRRGATNLIIALVITVLVVGYVPFASYLFRDVSVNYGFETKQIKEYGSDGGEIVGPCEVETVEISEGISVVINGLLMQGDCLEIPFGSGGRESIEASRMHIMSAFRGAVDELWVIIQNPDRHLDLEYPIYLSRIEGEQWDKLGWDDFTIYQQGETFGEFEDFYRHVIREQSTVGLAGCSVDDILVALAGKDGGTAGGQLLEMPIMGDHTVELLVIDNTLSIECEKVDLNENEGEDNVFLELKKKGGAALRRDVLPDDGNDGADGVKSRGPASVTYSLDDIPNGLYVLDIYSQDQVEDYVLTGVSTSAARAGFVEHINLFGEEVNGIPPRSSVGVFCNGFPGVLAAMLMWGPNGETTISTGGEEIIDLSKSWLARRRVNTTGVQELNVDNVGRLNLSNRRGSFSFDRQSITDPIGLLLKSLDSISQKEAGYIIVGEYGGLTYDGNEGLYRIDAMLAGVAINEECYFLLKKSGQHPLNFQQLVIEFIK
jgi:hypothetical protein